VGRVESCGGLVQDVRVRQAGPERFVDVAKGHINALDDFDAVLQVGTHAIIKSDRFKHYVFTDMTIVQAVNSPNARDFAAGKLPPGQHAEAIEAQRVIFESGEGVFVNSNWTRDSIVRDYSIDPDKVSVVGAGVSLPINALPEHRSGSHNILFIGRDWVRKGGPLLVEALSLVRRKYEDATLTVIGSNPRVKDANVEVLGVLDKKVASQRGVIEKALSKAGALWRAPGDFHR